MYCRLKNMNIEIIRNQLLDKGRELRAKPRAPIQFTKNQAADEFLNNIETFPHAYVLGCVVDRQMPSERAWMIPFKIAEAIGGRDFRAFQGISRSGIHQLMNEPTPLHRYADIMADNLFQAIQIIGEKYNGLASNIWADSPSSSEVVYRFLEFPGIGQKIATMAANILAREFKVPFADYYSIDISVDVHVRRVFGRLGLTPDNADNNQIIFRARSLSPEFPGLLDNPCFEIGKQWCKPEAPLCFQCYMAKICPSAK